MKQTRNRKGLFEILGVIGIILLIPLFFTMRSLAGPQTADATATIVWLTNTPVGSKGPAVSATATAVPRSTTAVVATGKEPPACSFPLAQTTTVASKPETYTFSEPQVVQAGLSNLYDIIEWLPDNQRVLITQTYQDKHYQSIELLNPKTGKVQVYATRTTTFETPPAWVPGLDAVIYPFTNLVNVDLNNPKALQPPYHLQRQLWISRGDPQGTQLLENAEITLPYESVYSVAVNPNSGEFIYLGDASEHPLQRKASQTSVEAAQSIPFDPAKFAYHGENPSLGISYKMSWRPGATQVFLYTDVSRSGQERYTFLLDTNSGQPCELNLSGKTPAGQLAVNLFPHWSPNGRFLAVISVGGFSVLDTATGHVYEIDEKQLISTDIKGQLSINDIAWAPDNRHLAATVQVSDYSVPPGENYIKLRDLYVIDFVSNRAVQIPSDIKFGTTYGHTSILWSDDGSQLLVMCSAPGGLCLLPVQQNTQP